MQFYFINFYFIILLILNNLIYILNSHTWLGATKLDSTTPLDGKGVGACQEVANGEIKKVFPREAIPTRVLKDD